MLYHVIFRVKLENPGWRWRDMESLYRMRPEAAGEKRVELATGKGPVAEQPQHQMDAFREVFLSDIIERHFAQGSYLAGQGDYPDALKAFVQGFPQRRKRMGAHVLGTGARGDLLGRRSHHSPRESLIGRNAESGPHSR